MPGLRKGEERWAVPKIIAIATKPEERLKEAIEEQLESQGGYRGAGRVGTKSRSVFNWRPTDGRGHQEPRSFNESTHMKA